MYGPGCGAWRAGSTSTAALIYYHNLLLRHLLFMAALIYYHTIILRHLLFTAALIYYHTILLRHLLITSINTYITIIITIIYNPTTNYYSYNILLSHYYH